MGGWAHLIGGKWDKRGPQWILLLQLRGQLESGCEGSLRSQNLAIQQGAKLETRQQEMMSLGGPITALVGGPSKVQMVGRTNEAEDLSFTLADTLQLALKLHLDLAKSRFWFRQNETAGQINTDWCWWD